MQRFWWTMKLVIIESHRIGRKNENGEKLLYICQMKLLLVQSFNIKTQSNMDIIEQENRKSSWPYSGYMTAQNFITGHMDNKSSKHWQQSRTPQMKIKNKTTRNTK